MYKVVSGLNENEVVDIVVGIKTFSEAQDIKYQKLKQGYQYCEISFYKG